MDETQILHDARSLANDLVAWRRDLHQHPELGFQEQRTAGVIAGSLRELGLEVQTGVAETGVVAVLEGGRPGRTLLMRWDMDGLPITEATGAEYASLASGRMHACGHDGHVAIGLGVARMLHARRKQLAGRVKLVFQPAEEGLGGAERMIAEGVLESPRPEVALGVHLWNARPVGWLGIRDGPMMAGADLLEIDLQGKGGHGAAPHQTHDPVVAAAQVVTALQTIVARNVDPGATAVISLTQIQAGEAFNVIPERAMLRGTLRTFEADVRQLLLRRIEQVALGVAEALECRAQVRITPLTPPVVNDPSLAARLRAVARRELPEAVIDESERSMVSEDMALFLQAVPGCFIFVGSANPARGLDAAHHHPAFDFDEAALPVAVALLTAAALDSLGST